MQEAHSDGLISHEVITAGLLIRRLDAPYYPIPERLQVAVLCSVVTLGIPSFCYCWR